MVFVKTSRVNNNKFAAISAIRHARRVRIGLIFTPGNEIAIDINSRGGSSGVMRRRFKREQ